MGVKSFFERIGADPADDSGLQLQKRVLVVMSFSIAVAAVAWGAAYWVFDERLAASIPWSYSLISGLSLLVFATNRQFGLFRASQLTLILVLPFLLQLSLGGFVEASAVILWSFLAPLGALLMSGQRPAIPWFAAFVALVAVAELVQPLVTVSNDLPAALRVGLFIMNIAGVSAITFATLFYFVGQKDEALGLLALEQEKSERLLLNILPREIAALLKDEEQTIAQSYRSISVLFVDLVGFTQRAGELAPAEAVDFLNGLFSRFDVLADGHGCEKIRTMGDGYMVACGVPVVVDDHAQRLARLALDIRDLLVSESVQFRMGLNTGPAVAGVIGKRKFQYDVWGDAVNVASRMETHGVPGRIQISDHTYRLLGDEFICELRGAIEVKGKGEMTTWFLEGVKSLPPRSEEAQ